MQHKFIENTDIKKINYFLSTVFKSSSIKHRMQVLCLNFNSICDNTGSYWRKKTHPELLFDYLLLFAMIICYGKESNIKIWKGNNKQEFHDE